MKKFALISAALLAVVVTAGTIAWAAGDSPTINACVASSSGDVRIPQGGDTCKKNESAVQWSVQGPQGLKGDTGPQGPAGQSGQGTPDAYTAHVGSLTAEGQKQGAFKKKITLLGFDYNVKSPRDAASGQATGKRQHSPVRIIKEIDATTPQFFQAAVTSENLKKVVIELPGSNGTIDYRITLTNSNVVSERQYDVGKGGQPSREEVELTFQKIEVESISGQTMAIDDWETAN
jgi:type VI secretion system secreted protein Hcp